METHLENENYDVYVDAKILGRHDPKALGDAFVAYVVKDMEERGKVIEVNAEETDDAEYKAILFAIHELKDKSKQFTIFCDHQSVVSEVTRKDFKETEKTNPLLSEIRGELVIHPNITLRYLEGNPAHTLLNEYLQAKKKELAADSK